MSSVPTSSAKVTRQVQYYAEINGYKQPVVNPTLNNAGIITGVTGSISIEHQPVHIQGSRLQYADISMGFEGSIATEYMILDTKLIRYGITNPAGSGTIGESIAFIESRKINNVEEFRLAQGCISDSLTINLDKIPTVSQPFYASKISNWMTISQLRTALGLTGTTDPTWASPITADPWTHLYGTDENSSAVTVNGSPVDVNKMSVTINNNLLKQKPLGYKNVRYVEPGNKEVSISIEPYLYDNTFYDLVNNFTTATVVLRLKATTPVVDLTITGCKFNSYEDKSDASNNDFTTTPVSGTAVDATITSYP